MTKRDPLMARRRSKVGGARSGAGRPPLGAAARSEVVRVSVTPAMRARIAEARGDASESEWALALFERALVDG